MGDELRDMADKQRIEQLEEAIRKARIQISGGLCYFSAEAKHAQLADADRTLAAAIGEVALPDRAMANLGHSISTGTRKD